MSEHSRHRLQLRRRAALALRATVLLAFGLSFGVPLLWLVLATTRTDFNLVTGPPLAFGSLHNVWVAWQGVYAANDHIFRRWIGNSLAYSLSATAIILATGIPAGYGLAFGTFPARKLLLKLTLVALIMPS